MAEVGGERLPRPDRHGLILLRKEENAARDVRSAWDAKMVPAGDDRIAGG
ncbi:hypothetical protein GCM10010254_16450 [Streptomyces chromofuscus]|nr:hypothetical protein GCM10010254_16450 [Streptomyces chromofuscus]